MQITKARYGTARQYHALIRMTIKMIRITRILEAKHTEHLKHIKFKIQENQTL